jgi:hypothetical protein
MSAKRERPESILSSFTFWIGMGFILAAPLLNFAYDRMTKARIGGDGSEVLPESLAALYNLGGKLGVTLSLVLIGLTILGSGALWQRMKRQRAEALRAAEDAAQDPFHTGSDSSEQGAPLHGQLVLQTRKYFR